LDKIALLPQFFFAETPIQKKGDASSNLLSFTSLNLLNKEF